MSNKDTIRFISEKANESATYSYNINSHYITITEDKLRSKLEKHENIIRASKSWIGNLIAIIGFAFSLYMSYKQANEIIKIISYAFIFLMTLLTFRDFRIYWKNRDKGIDFLIESFLGEKKTDEINYVVTIVPAEDMLTNEKLEG